MDNCMKLKELIGKLQAKAERLGDVDVIVRGRFGFLSEVDDITDDRSHDDDEPFVSIDVDDDDGNDYEDEAPYVSL